MIQHCQYHCPHCEKSLTTNKTVNLKFKTEKNDEKAAIYLDPKPGNYDFYTKPKINFEKGEKLTFFCPKCKANLTSKKNPDFVELKMMVNNFIFFEALFSNIYGEKKTYIVTQDEIDTYGDAEPNDNIFMDLEDLESDETTH